ncbi:MAG: hypothetical protein U0822_16900 [Anaerolineae bacterium]
MIKHLFPSLVLALLVTAFLSTSVHADGPNPDRPQPHVNRDHLNVQTRVESRRDGVYVEISVQQSTPGEDRPSPHARATDEPSNNTASATTATSSAQPVSTGPQERYWSNNTGIYRETVDGHVIQLTPPPIGTASLSAWDTARANHPDQTPYLLYVDDQYNGVVWIPQSPQNGNVRIEAMPSAQPSRPSGDDNSTDAREVALSALGHVRLPDMHVRVNPSLGLVNLPGWFWVDGYDGRPFGVSRTVHVPPEIGDDVPDTVVPADDPRRRGTSFTVSVRIWPSQYEWNFGDDHILVTDSLGKPHPAESDIQHTYETSSLGFANGFPVRLSVTFHAEYRVNGGPAEALPSITQVVEYGYRVQEAQSVLTGH